MDIVIYGKNFIGIARALSSDIFQATTSEVVKYNVNRIN